MAAVRPFPVGSFPTMITPFTVDGAIDWTMLGRLVDWYIAAGSVGLFSPCLSSEFYHLTDDERVELARRVRGFAAGRALVVATGNYGGPIESQAEMVRRMAPCCDAVVIVTCHLAPEGASDDQWLENAQRLLDLTPGVPLGLYECPVPYKRLLSPELVRWAAASGRFVFHKDTSCDMSQITAKIRAIEGVGGASPFRFYNANVETLVESMRAGGHGFSGISANFYPHLHAFVTRACALGSGSDASDAETARKVDSVQVRRPPRLGKPPHPPLTPYRPAPSTDRPSWRSLRTSSSSTTLPLPRRTSACCLAWERPSRHTAATLP
jgi:4-hydroxy-tetrahydrodipicolinate synthase